MSSSTNTQAIVKPGKRRIARSPSMRQRLRFVHLADALGPDGRAHWREWTRRRSFGVAQIGKAVADAAFGENVVWIGRVVLEFLAQVVDVQADIVRRVTVLGSPDTAEECLM